MFNTLYKAILNSKSFNEKFYPVFNALKSWKINVVVDGEIVVVNDKGIPDFSDLQSWRSEADLFSITNF